MIASTGWEIPVAATPASAPARKWSIADIRASAMALSGPTLDCVNHPRLLLLCARGDAVWKQTPWPSGTSRPRCSTSCRCPAPVLVGFSMMQLFQLLKASDLDWCLSLFLLWRAVLLWFWFFFWECGVLFRFASAQPSTPPGTPVLAATSKRS
jgi:hypothetical protein